MQQLSVRHNQTNTTFEHIKQTLESGTHYEALRFKDLNTLHGIKERLNELNFTPRQTAELLEAIGIKGLLRIPEEDASLASEYLKLADYLTDRLFGEHVAWSRIFSSAITSNFLKYSDIYHNLAMNCTAESQAKEYFWNGRMCSTLTFKVADFSKGY